MFVVVVVAFTCLLLLLLLHVCCCCYCFYMFLWRKQLKVTLSYFDKIDISGQSEAPAALAAPNNSVSSLQFLGIETFLDGPYSMRS